MSRYMLSTNLLSSQLNDNTAILNVQAGTYYGLNEVGTCVWELLTQAPASLEHIREHVMAQFDVDEPTCTNDLNRLLNELVREKLVNVV